MLFAARIREEGRLVFSVPFYPGWRAWLNGRLAPLTLQDGLVMSIAPPAGAGLAHFRFTPTGWPLLCLVSVCAWIAWATLFLKGPEAPL